MYFIKLLRSSFCVLFRVVRTLTTLFWRVLHRNLSLPHIRQINMESDGECDLDSTWEDENEHEEHRNNVNRRSSGRYRNMYAAKDMRDFRHSCRNLDDVDEDDDDNKRGEACFYNLEFYHGRIKSSPDDVHIDEFHQHWKGQYRWLEDCHSYIQWLFPIQERGVNWDAHVLTKMEIKVFRKDEEAKKKLVKSYELMLDFYGIRLVNEATGEVQRADNWEKRFNNLNRYSHNNLRITRILKCLGTLGLQHYQAPLVKFFLHETLVEKQLQRMKQSVLDYFVFAVLDKSERQDLVRFAFDHFKPREQFVWGPKKRLSGKINAKNERFSQLTENKDNSMEDHKQQREPSERTHEENEINASNPVGSVLNGITRVKDQQAIDTEIVETGSDKNNKDEQHPDENSQCSSGDEREKQNQELRDGDAKKSGEVHSESTNFGQLTENRTAEGGQQGETSEKTHEVKQTDAVNPGRSVLNGKTSVEDQQAIDTQTVETGSDKNKDEQHPDENSQCKSDDGIMQNQKVRDEETKNSGEVHSENKNFGQLTENRTAEGGQQGETSEKAHGVNQTDAVNPGRSVLNGKTSVEDQQAIDTQTAETGSDKNNKEENDPNENSQCSSGDEREKQNQEVGDGDAKKSGEVHSENTNFGQLTDDRTAEDRQQGETSEKTKPNGCS